MAYSLRLTPRFKKNFQRLTKKDHVLRDRVYSKLSEICDNPSIGETLSHNLAGMLSAHVGNWVIIYGSSLFSVGSEVSLYTNSY